MQITSFSTLRPKPDLLGNTDVKKWLDNIYDYIVANENQLFRATVETRVVLLEELTRATIALQAFGKTVPHKAYVAADILYKQLRPYYEITKETAQLRENPNAILDFQKTFDKFSTNTQIRSAERSIRHAINDFKDMLNYDLSDFNITKTSKETGADFNFVNLKLRLSSDEFKGSVYNVNGHNLLAGQIVHELFHAHDRKFLSSYFQNKQFALVIGRGSIFERIMICAYNMRYKLKDGQSQFDKDLYYNNPLEYRAYALQKAWPELVKQAQADIHDSIAFLSSKNIQNLVLGIKQILLQQPILQAKLKAAKLYGTLRSTNELFQQMANVTGIGQADTQKILQKGPVSSLKETLTRLGKSEAGRIYLGRLQKSVLTIEKNMVWSQERLNSKHKDMHLKDDDGKQSGRVAIVVNSMQVQKSIVDDINSIKPFIQKPKSPVPL